MRYQNAWSWKTVSLLGCCLFVGAPIVTQAAEPGSARKVFWGDTHLHTSYSPDAFLMRNQSADPDTAYRYAKGLPVVHPLHRVRIQIIKGWLDKNGNAHEKMYDVALSDGRQVGADGKVPPVGNTVDLETARYTNSIGATQLATVWMDPDFDPQLRAFYYARVLQIPTPRHTLYDTVALGIEHPKNHPPTIQERAYTSPIWYTLGK